MIVETADYDYEQQLVDRIALKEIVRALPYRQKDVILGRYIRGETLEEVGQRQDVSRERIRQIERRALKQLRDFAKRRRRPLPQPQPLPKPAKPVVKKPPEDKRAIFERELRSLRAAFTPSRPVYTPPPPPPYYQFAQHELETLAAEALKQFLNIRRSAYLGTRWLGPMCSGVRYPRIGGNLLSAVEALANEIPRHAHLSAHKLEVSAGQEGANASDPQASLRVTHNPHTDMIFFHVTWDHHG